MAKLITLPNKWNPRHYQLPVFQAFEQGIKRFILVYHRRAGKDSMCINLLAMAAMQRVGNYLYLFPTARQARKALWDSIDKQGRKVIDQAVPVELRKRIRNDEMFIELANGSTVQVAGADNYDAIVGTNYIGIVFSEYALTSPTTWRYLSPILMENDGWAIFNSTPRGKNHLYQLYQQNVDNPLWYTQIAPWWKTGVLTQAQIDEEIRSGMPQEIADQEFGCSFDSANIGAIYRRELETARRQQRIASVPYDGRFPVECSWDIGHRDATAIWFFQRVGKSIHVIDYFEDRGKGLPHYATEIGKREYGYARHVGPHDLNHKIFAVDATTLDIARNHGIHFVVAPKLSIDEGIQATRSMLSRCHFDAVKCADGLAALDSYEREWDEDTRQLSDKPLHNWASHGSDSFRYFAVTPEGLGIVPEWARQDMQSRVGHNGGPPLEDAEFDPLAVFRGSQSYAPPAWVGR